MEGLFTDLRSTPEMTQKSLPTLSMFGRRSHAPRPISEATMIFDTDDEDDTDSQPSSLEFDASSIASSKEGLKTPPSTAGLGGFTFHFESDVKGPEGPHLFRASSTGSTRELLEVTPIPLPRQPRRIQSLHAALSQLDETQVRDWSPRQVANWMAEAGFEHSVVEKFLIHDIYGSVLLDLEMDDLKEIDIETFGKRKRVMSSIQHLRNSSMISSDVHLPLSSSPERAGRSLSRAARTHETHLVTRQRTKSRRGRRSHDDIIHPAESVSIVAIEQLLPEPHTCSKGANCSKWQKQQRKIQKITADFAEESDKLDAKSTVAPSTVGPSVAGSSDVLGPISIPITAELLNNVELQDSQDNVRQFLEFQSTQKAKGPSPPPAPSAVFAAKTANLMNGLPRLTIPTIAQNPASPERTPISALRFPTRAQAETKAALLSDPYHYGGVASPADVYRIATPMSETDLPVTALAIDPCQERDFSQSVPPEMHYGAPPSAIINEPIQRCASTQLRRRQNSFVPKVAPVMEIPPVVTSEADLANHAGWMRKRKTTRMLRHEWQDSYFNLSGAKLDMLRDELDTTPLETIDVEEYDVHAYTTPSGSKLQSAFKKTLGAADKEPSFAFTLIPEDQKDNKKLFEKTRSHHFAVNSGRDRVEWMRKLMLAKALKKNHSAIPI